jgi:transposase
MKHCGFDVGKKSSHFCIVNEKREIQKEGKVRNRKKDLGLVFGSMQPMRIVLEVSCKSFWLADQLKRLGHQPIVVDPGRTKAIGAARIKHDRLDAKILAELCQANLLAVVDQPTQEDRFARMPVTVRAGLVRARVQLMNTVRSIADSEGVEIPGSDPMHFTTAVNSVLRTIPKAMVYALQPMVDSIDSLTESISHCDQALLEVAKNDPTMQLLQTCPGVGPISSAAYAQAIRDPRRFTSGRAVGAYLGLVPSLYASGKTYRRGGITKCGNRQARWLLTMAANSLLRCNKDSAIKRWGIMLTARIGRRKAVTAIARKLAAILWAMWRDHRAFEARLVASS